MTDTALNRQASRVGGLAPMHHNTRLPKDFRHAYEKGVSIGRVSQLTQMPVFIVVVQRVSFGGEEEFPELRGFSPVSKRVHSLRVCELKREEEIGEDLT